MPFDIQLVKDLYSKYPEHISNFRKIINRPLTLSEKILFTHLSENQKHKNFNRGIDYVDFNPDRVAMQDATAQMALLNLCKQEKSL